jgi:hypothetical protein
MCLQSRKEETEVQSKAETDGGLGGGTLKAKDLAFKETQG